MPSEILRILEVLVNGTRSASPAWVQRREVHLIHDLDARLIVAIEPKVSAHESLSRNLVFFLRLISYSVAQAMFLDCSVE